MPWPGSSACLANSRVKFGRATGAVLWWAGLLRGESLSSCGEVARSRGWGGASRESPQAQRAAFRSLKPPLNAFSVDSPRAEQNRIGGRELADEQNLGKIVAKERGSGWTDLTLMF